MEMFRKYQKTTLVLGVIFAFLATDAILGNVYKIVVGYPFFMRQEKLVEKAENVIRRNEKRYRVSSNIYHHTLKKNCNEIGQYGERRYKVCTNSLGFRSGCSKSVFHVNNQNLIKKKRILFLGDSFTEGVGIEYENTFPGIIENSLFTRHIDILNAAVISYSPIIYWRKTKNLIEDIGLKFDEAFVFLDISDIQDEAVVYELSAENCVIQRDTIQEKLKNKQVDEPIKKIIRHNFVLLYFVLNKLYDFFYNSGNLREKNYNSKYFLKQKRSLWTVDKIIYEEYGKKGLKKAAYYMDLLYKLLKDHDIAMSLCVYPWPDQIMTNDLNSIQVNYWRDWADKRKVSFLNFFPLFISSESSNSENELTIERFFIKGDAHWNEAGHRLIAENLMTFYLDRGGKEGN